MKNAWILSFLLILGIAGCRSTGMETMGTPGETTIVTGDAVPAGTQFTVQLNQPLSTENARGDNFTATLVDEVATPTGEVLIPSGATVHGTVTGVTPAPNEDDHAAIRLNFERIEAAGTTYPIAAEVVETDLATVQDDRSLVGEETVIGAAAGAALGAVVTGDVTGAVIGGALGAGVGTIISLGSGDTEGMLPAGTVMTLETEADITMR